MNTIVVTKKNFGEAIAQMYEYICAKPKTSFLVNIKNPGLPDEATQELINEWLEAYKNGEFVSLPKKATREQLSSALRK